MLHLTLVHSLGLGFFLFIFRELSLVDNVFTIKQMKLDYLKLQIISFFCTVRIWIEA